MTPEELRKLADVATPESWLYRIVSAEYHGHVEVGTADEGVDGGVRYVCLCDEEDDARLIALAPDLARLCADMGQLLSRVAAFEPWWSDPAVDDEAPLWEDAQAALAKFAELNNGAEVPPESERT